MTITDQINAQVKTLVDEVKNLTETLKKFDVEDVQKKATDLSGVAAGRAKSSYDDLVKKGEEFVAQARALKLDDVQKRAEKLVESLRKDASKNLKEAQKNVKDVREDVAKRADEVVADAQAAVAKVTGKAPAKKAPAKKTSTTATKSAPAKKA